MGAGHIQGRLYVVTEVDAEGQNRYPAAVPSADPADRVWGEIWHIEDQTIWPEFDAYEDSISSIFMTARISSKEKPRNKG